MPTPSGIGDPSVCTTLDPRGARLAPVGEINEAGLTNDRISPSAQRARPESGRADPDFRLALDRADLGAFAALLAATLAFFWPMIRPFGARWYIVAGDFSNQFYPFRAFAASEWWAGRIPLWNPDLLAGHPFVADIQTAVFYPLALANALAFGRNGFPFIALEGEIVLHTFLAAAFTFLLARRLSGSRLGGLVAGLAFGFGGYITSYPAQQLAVLETAVWLPLIVLCLDLATDRAIRWHWLVAAAAAFALALLAGHPQNGLFIAYAAEGWLLWRLWRQRAPLTRAVLTLVWFPLLAGMLAAIQLFPTLAFLRDSTRDQMSYLEAAHGYLPSSLWQVFVPLWHNEKALSVGVVALCLAMIGAWASRREALAYWTVLGLLAIPLSTGGSTPLFALLYRFAPGWNLFRDQERVIYLFSLAVVLLAARGVAELQRTVKSRREGLAYVGLAAGGAMIAALLWTVLTIQGTSASFPQSLRGNLALDAALLVALAVLFRLRLPACALASLPGRYFGVDLVKLAQWANFTKSTPKHSSDPALGPGAALVLAGLVLGEAFAINYGNNLTPLSPDPRPRLAASAAFMRNLGEPFRIRAASEAVFPSDYGALLNLPTIGGDTPFQAKRINEMLKADADWRVWQILNVKFYLSEGEPLAGLKLVFQDGPLKTYAVQDSLPRAWAVRAVEVAASPAEARSLILAPDYHPGNVAVLEEAPTIGPFTPGDRPEARIKQLEAQRVEIDTSGDGNALLVLANRYDPDWRAYRDGVEVPVFTANYLALAVELPPGQHHFEFVYRPTAFYVGAVISGLALLAGALAILASSPSMRRALRPNALDFRVGRLPWWVIALLILIFGFALRVHAGGVPNLTNDEWFMLRNHDEGPRWIIHQSRVFEPHPLLYYLGLAGWIELAGRSELALRFPSILFGTLLIAAVLGLARRLIGRRGALLAGLLVALNPYQIAESQNARNYAMVTALSALASLLFWRALRRGRRRDWIAYGVAMLLALNTHYDAALILAAHAVFVILRAGIGRWHRSSLRRSQARLRDWLVTTLAIGLVFGLWLVWAGPALLAYHGYFPEPVGVIRVLSRSLATFSLGSSSAIRAALPFFALAGIGVALLLIRRAERAVFLALIVLLPIGAVAGLFLFRPMFDERYLIVLAPGYLMILAAAVEGLLRRNWPVGIMALVGSLALIVPSIPAVYRDALADRGDYRAMAAWISTYGAPDDVIVATGHGQAELFGYYYRGQAPIQVIDQPKALATRLPEISSGHGIWLLPYWQSDADAVAEATLSQVTAPVAERWFVNTRALYYPSLSSLSPSGVTGQWDGKLKLDQAGLTGGEARPGEAIGVRFHWVIAHPSPSPKLSLRLRDESGRFIAQHDALLSNRDLNPGRLESRAGLFIPVITPPGTYQVAALLYDPGSGRPWPLETTAPRDGDAVILGNLSVGPREKPILAPDESIPRRGPIRFDAGVSLVGSEPIDSSGLAGERLFFRVIWRLDRPIAADPAHTIDFVDASGKVIGSDVAPLLPSYPPSRWFVGQSVAEPVSTRIPPEAPSGRYTVRIRAGNGPAAELGTLVVTALERRTTRPEVAQDVDARFGTFARLIGVSGLPESAAPGDTITLQIAWAASDAADRPYTAFVHLLDPQGKVHAQVDRPPANGSRPTDTWTNGEYFEDTYTLSIAPDASSGIYPIEVGLYDPRSGVRVPARWANGHTDDHVIVGVVTVGTGQ